MYYKIDQHSMSPLHCIINWEVFYIDFCRFLIISYVTAMNLCNGCSGDGEVLRFVTVNKASIPQFRVFFRNIVEKY